MTKRDELIERLRAGWVTNRMLCEHFGWKPKTLRGVLSTLRMGSLAIDRQRVDGVTSYRIAPEVEERGANDTSRAVST